MDYWALALLLMTVGLGLAVLEIFFPSGGVLGFLCAVSIAASIFLGFQSSALAGTGMVVLAVIGLPSVIILALQWLPHTPIGRRILLEAPASDDVLPDTERSRSLKELVGKVGKAKSKMLPAGAITIDGRTYDAVAEGVAVEPGTWVRVLEVRGIRIVVRPLDEDEVGSVSEVDDLARPIDSIAEDPFADERTDPGDDASR